MSTSLSLTSPGLLEVGGLVVAAGYLLATAGRSRRAAALGLAGLGMIGLSVLGWPRGLWPHSVLLAGGYVFLMVALLADRRTPADAD